MSTSNIRRKLGLKVADRDLGGDETSRLIASYRKTGSALKVRAIFVKRADGQVVQKNIPWNPRSGYIYTQVRAISARVNQNYDAWPSSQLKKYYRSFIGKPIFVNHNNEDPELARGVVVAARYIEKEADKYIECIMETDAKRFPKLAKEIRTGGLDSVSMGVEAGFTICSVCRNKAADLHDMCEHIRFHKGEYIKDRKTGKKQLVYEDCFKLGFFELSYVFDPADETAVVSRVIAAGKKTADESFKPIGWDRYAPTHKETEQNWHPQSEAYQDHAPVNTIKRNIDPEITNAYDNASVEEKAYLDPLDFYSPYKPSKQEYQVRDRDRGESRMSRKFDPQEYLAAIFPSDSHQLSASKGVKSSKWYTAESDLPRLLLDTAPEDIDTLRDESEDDTDLFHHWVQSPPDLRAPNMNKTKKLDQAQEGQGLDGDRRAEDAEEYGAPSQGQPQFLDEEPEQDPVMPMNPPTTKKGRRTQKGVPMSRFYYAADEDGGEEGDGADSGEYTEGDTNTDDIDQLLDEAEADIDQYQGQDDGGFDDGSGDDSGGFDPDGDGDDDSTPEGDTDHDYFPEDGGGETDEEFGGDDSGSCDDSEGEDAPPWADEKEARTVRRRASRGNKRGGAMTGSTLSQRARVASQGRRFHADDNGHTDGGPYGVDDSQGAQEEIFISQVPGAEAVEVGGDGQISNSPGNLVAKRAEFDPAHYQRIADVVKALPSAQRGAMASKMVRMFQADNRRFNPMAFFEAAQVPMVRRGNRYFIAEDLASPDKVDPGLSGTDVQELKGSDFESLALENVETQPKDASIHAFRSFDSWLQRATGHTAAQHGNANYIRRAVASYVQKTGASLEGLFPTLEYVLAEARKVEGRKANMRKRAEDKSLEVAAPEGRIDVEAPVKNVTDADAQASQFDLGDFAHNAGDQLADPVLDATDGNAGTWAPDKEAKLANGVEAVRLAEAYLKAMPGTYKEANKWELIARFESMRSAAVRDRIRVLEAVIQDNQKTARKVTAATSRGTRGIPQGLGQRTAAGVKKVSANDPATDYGLFI